MHLYVPVNSTLALSTRKLRTFPTSLEMKRLCLASRGSHVTGQSPSQIRWRGEPESRIMSVPTGAPEFSLIRVSDQPANQNTDGKINQQSLTYETMSEKSFSAYVFTEQLVEEKNVAYVFYVLTWIQHMSCLNLWCTAHCTLYIEFYFKSCTEIAEEVLYSVFNLDLPAVKPKTIHCNSVCLTSSLFFFTQNLTRYISGYKVLFQICVWEKGLTRLWHTSLKE